MFKLIFSIYFKYFFLLFLLLKSCKKQSDKSNFDCNEYVSSTSIFPRMKNINHLKKMNGSEIKPFNISVDSCFFSEETSQHHSRFQFDSHDYGLNLEVFFKNDSLIVKGDGLMEPIVILNKKIETFQFWDYQVNLESQYFSENCKDTVYVFNYKNVANPEISRIGNLSLKNIYISKKRGLLKLIFKDSINNYWETLN